MLGWLLQGNRDQALHTIYAIYSTPPREWLQAIMEEVWPILEHDPTYLALQTLHEELFKQVGLVERKLLDNLRSIQEVYEGGPPPV